MQDITPRFNYYKAQDKDGIGHIMFYCQWGDPKNKDVVVCVHGLSRNSRDFDYVAKDLAKDYNVICVDVIGRGKSEWVQNKALYDYENYVLDLVGLIEHLDVGAVHWVGTSMGGIIGMMIASKYPKMIKSLLLNDVGPVIPGEAIRRILTYLGASYSFQTKEDAEISLRKRMVSFGIHKEEHWQHVIKHSIVKKINGKYTFSYDPEILPPMRFMDKLKYLLIHLMPDHRKPAFPDFSMFDAWEEITCPILAIKGCDSDVLTQEVVDKMQKSKPDMQLIEFANTGHAPMLMEDQQIKAVVDWLKNYKK